MTQTRPWRLATRKKKTLHYMHTCSMTVSSSFLILCLWILWENDDKVVYNPPWCQACGWTSPPFNMMSPKATHGHVSGYWVLTQWYRHSLIGCNFGSHRDPTPLFGRIIGWYTRFIYRKILTNLKWRSSKGQRSKVKVNCHLMKYCPSNVVFLVIWKGLIS